MTRQNIGGVLLALSDQLPACRRFIRHQTHSMAYAIADSHRFLLVLLQRGRGAMAIHPSAYQAVDRLFRAPHVPAVHQ